MDFGDRLYPSLFQSQEEAKQAAAHWDVWEQHWDIGALRALTLCSCFLKLFEFALDFLLHNVHHRKGCLEGWPLRQLLDKYRNSS